MSNEPPGDSFRSDRMLDDPAFLQALRTYMLRFALSQLKDPAAAEDVVQEALVGALKNQASFARTAAFRTWVFAILRNKIADALRARLRQRDREVAYAFDDEEAPDDRFDERGAWRASHRPSHWADPENAAMDTQFWAVFEACLEHLPGRSAQVFMMREFIGLETDEICSTLGMSANSVFVSLFRSRARLRECLESRWFDKEKP